MQCYMLFLYHNIGDGELVKVCLSVDRSRLVGKDDVLLTVTSYGISINTSTHTELQLLWYERWIIVRVIYLLDLEGDHPKKVC